MTLPPVEKVKSKFSPEDQARAKECGLCLCNVRYVKYLPDGKRAKKIEDQSYMCQRCNNCMTHDQFTKAIATFVKS